MQTSLRRRHRDRVVRRGLGLMIESDFYAYARATQTPHCVTLFSHSVLHHCRSQDRSWTQTVCAAFLNLALSPAYEPLC